MSVTRILVLGGGFGGVAVCRRLERTLARRPDVEVTLVNHENFFLFTPMLHEVAASDLEITHIVSPIRKLLRRVAFVVGDVERIDLERRVVHVTHAPLHHRHELPFDHLVLALGSVTQFFDLPGLQEHALTMKSLGDALRLRNRMIENLESADFECATGQRTQLLTFVVAGGGFAGVETIAAMHDFLHAGLRYYSHLEPGLLRLILVHSGDGLIPELDAPLGRYARAELERRGIEVRTGTRVLACGPETTTLSDGDQIVTSTLVWTAGTTHHPLLKDLPCPQEKGRIRVDACLRVVDVPGVWALGDAAFIPDARTGGSHPPTAQHALREGRCVADNLRAVLDGRPLRPFRFRTLGQLAALGRRRGVARVLGWNFSGFVAWFLWRTIYLSKLPRFERKCRVALDWALDLVFSRDLTQVPTKAGAAPRQRSAPVATEPITPAKAFERSV